MSNPKMANALSGSDVDCKSPTTYRLSVLVSEELQRTKCPLLEKAEEALGVHVAADPRVQDKEQRDAFALAMVSMRLLRNARCTDGRVHVAALK